MAIDRASWVMGTEEIQSWLGESKSSRSLLINGNSDPLENTSPLSLFCAHLTHLFVAVKPVIVVSYFCGLHADLVTDPRANAQGMMISLIGQLLLQARQKRLHFDMSFLGRKKRQLLAVDDLRPYALSSRSLSSSYPRIESYLSLSTLSHCMSPQMETRISSMPGISSTRFSPIRVSRQS